MKLCISILASTSHASHAMSGLAVLLAIVAGVALMPLGCARNGSEQQASRSAAFICPMHPSVVSDTPGDCSICGMKLVPIKENKHELTTTSAKKTMYRSTMNPNEMSDKPGQDSMGMEMEPFRVSEGSAPSVPGLATVSIPDEARRRMGLTLGRVEKKDMSRTIRTSARIVADETRQFRVTTKVDGWVDKLHVSVSGQSVRMGDPLLTVYSPQLVSAQQEYLSTFHTTGSAASNSVGSVDGGLKVLLESARQRLQLWDVSDDQIARLERTGQVEKTVTLYAPASGIVADKGVMAGQKIVSGESLMVVTDLSVVWGEADIYESDLPYVQVGMPMEISLPYWPGKMFSGKVSFISSSLDRETRTLKVKMEITNPELLLKIEMFADARISYPLGSRLVAPESAIMRTGERNYAFREREEGRLEPIEVKVGIRNSGYYEILSGLTDGDSVVTSANFLVDSESSMRAALEALSKKSP
jgi:membrane fusion protein, copper/silver efflux system